LTVATEVEEVELVNEAFFFEEVDGAVDGDEVDARIDFLGAREDLVHVEMLLGIVHDLEEDAALAGQADTALTERLLEVAGGLGGVETLTAGDTACRCDGHGEIVPQCNGLRRWEESEAIRKEEARRREIPLPRRARDDGSVFRSDWGNPRVKRRVYRRGNRVAAERTESRVRIGRFAALDRKSPP